MAVRLAGTLKQVEQEFDEFLRCGRLEHGFLRVVCDDCKHEKLVAFSCKKRGFYPSCGARRMAESAKLLVDDVLQGYPVRQWVLSLPIPLRLLLARYPKQLSKVMQIIHRAISTDMIHRSRYLKKQANTGAVTYIQRFSSALNLNIHFHMLFLEGVVTQEQSQSKFKYVKALSHSDMENLVHLISQRIANYLEKMGLIQKDMDKPYQARSMSWAQRLKRVFNIDITQCERCEKSNVRIVACITEPGAIQKILAHLNKHTGEKDKPATILLPPLRVPPSRPTTEDYVIQRDFDFGA